MPDDASCRTTHTRRRSEIAPCIAQSNPEADSDQSRQHQHRTEHKHQNHQHQQERQRRPFGNPPRKHSHPAQRVQRTEKTQQVEAGYPEL